MVSTAVTDNAELMEAGNRENALHRIKSEPLILNGDLGYAKPAPSGLCDDPADLKVIDTELRRLVEEAPSDASVRFVVRKIGNHFRGFVRIHSRQKYFGLRASGERLQDVAEKLFGGASRQLGKWKRSRVLETHGWGE